MGDPPGGWAGSWLEKTLKNASLLACLLAFGLAAPALAQTGEGDTPAEGAAPDAPETAAPDEAPAEEPEPEVSEPEPEVSEPEPELAAPRPADAEDADALGDAATTPSVEEDLEAAASEGDDTARRPGETEAQRRRRLGASERPEGTADRLASANPTAGLPWSIPTIISPSLSVRSFMRDSQLTYDPQFTTFFSMRPRWNFTPDFSVGLRQDLTVQFTESNITTTTRELQWGDAQFDATYTLPVHPGGLSFITALTGRFGTSQFSRGMERRFAPGGRVLVLRPTPVAGQVLILGGGMSYFTWLGGNSSIVPRDGGFPCSVVGDSGVQGVSSCPVDGARTAVANQHQVSFGVFGTLVFLQTYQLNFSFTAIPAKNYDLERLTIDRDVTTENGEPLVVEGRGGEWNWTTSFSVSVGHDFASWVTLSLGYNTLAIHPDSDGGVENVFLNEFTTLALTAQFRPSALAVELMEEDETEAAIREAQTFAF